MSMAARRMNRGSIEGLKIPRQAAAAGFSSLIFEDDFDTITTIDINNTKANGFKWYVNKPAWGAVTPATDYSVANSVLTINQSVDNWQWGIMTKLAGTNMAQQSGYGKTFKYGYFEAKIRFDPNTSAALNSPGFPAWWSMGADHVVNGNGGHWGELDFFEAYRAQGSPVLNQLFGTMHDHYDSPNRVTYSSIGNHTTLLPGVNFARWHRYGVLWQPGRVQWFFDDQPLHVQQYFADAAPVPNQRGNPVGTFSILDTEPYGNALILGTGPGFPFDIDWVRVWHT